MQKVLWKTACLLILACASASAQNRAPSAAVELRAPNGVAIANDGGLYISDIEVHRVFHLDRRGRWRVVAGTGTAGFSGDGEPAINAQLNAPHDLMLDAAGNLLIADSGNHRVRRIDRQGIITTIAGDGHAGKAGYNDPASATSLNYPQGLALDAAGHLLIADTYNHVVRKLDGQSRLAIFAGTVAGYGGDGGPATKAQMSLPMAIAVAPDGGVYISDAGNSRIRRVASDGKIQTIAGYGPAQDTYGGGFAGEDVPVAQAKLFSATDLKCDATGNLYIVDGGNHRVRVVRDGLIRTLAGSGKQGSGGDGAPATAAELDTPQKLALAADGGFYLTDRAQACLRHVDARGRISTIRPAPSVQSGRSIPATSRRKP